MGAERSRVTNDMGSRVWSESSSRKPLRGRSSRWRARERGDRTPPWLTWIILNAGGDRRRGADDLVDFIVNDSPFAGRDENSSRHGNCGKDCTGAERNVALGLRTRLDGHVESFGARGAASLHSDGDHEAGGIRVPGVASQSNNQGRANG